MRAIRGVMTVFMLIVLGMSFLGWRWSAGLPSPKLEGARAVLVLIAAAAVAGLGLIWSVKPRKIE